MDLYRPTRDGTCVEWIVCASRFSLIVPQYCSNSCLMACRHSDADVTHSEHAQSDTLEDGLRQNNTLASNRSHGQPDFAHVKNIAPFLPKADPGNSVVSWKQLAWWSSFRRLLLGACVLSVIVLAVNIIGTILLSTLFETTNIYHGSCKTANRLNARLHIVINILSTALLGASNMCMQFMAAPTRENADKAHENGNWVDIGISSIRNLKYVDKKNRIVCFALVVSSAPLALL